jgi:SAM-dependent methyltransferase
LAQLHFPLDGQSLITPHSVSNQLPLPHQPDGADRLRTSTAEFSIAINIAMQRFTAGKDVPEAVKWLIQQLHDIRHRAGAAVWQELVPIIQAHPSAKVLQQCPFTRWSFEKPRGYSGDASLIDFIYGHPAVATEVSRSTRQGLDIFQYTINAPGPVAVRERREIMARFVDETAARVGSDTEVLAVAAGHLREAEISRALAEGRVRRWVALDQDPDSILSISSQFDGTAIQPMTGSVRGLLARKYEIGTFDFIYAAGLYDYLSDKVAIRLTQICLQMLKPGGVFLFANFSDEMADDGYMESYMDWELLQRSEADMCGIASRSAQGTSTNVTVWFGTNRNIIYGAIRKLP